MVQCLYGVAIIYSVGYGMVKISILCLCHRVFALTRFRMIAKFWICFLILNMIAAFVTSVFACNPIAGFWDASVSAWCVNDVVEIMCFAVINIITDLVVLIMPMPIIWHLNIARRQKYILSAIFVLGSL